MEHPTYFLPSEVARLVLGYLKVSQHKLTYKCFLKESEHLVEYAAMMKKGIEYPTTIMGVSLLELLEEYAELKLKDKGQGLFPIDIGAVWKQFDAVTRTLKQKTKTHSVKSSCHQQRQRTKKRTENISLPVPAGQTTQPSSHTTVNSSTGLSIIKVVPGRFTCKPSTSVTSVGLFQTRTNVTSDVAVNNTESKNTRRSSRIATRVSTQNRTRTVNVDNTAEVTVDNTVVDTVDNTVDCDTDNEDEADMDCDLSVESSPAKDERQHPRSAERNETTDEIVEPPCDMGISENSSNRSDAVYNSCRHSDSEIEETDEACVRVDREEKRGPSEWMGEEESQHGPKSPTVWLREVDPQQGLTGSSSHTDSHALHIVNESPVKRIVPQEHRTPVKALIQDSQTCDTNMTNGKSPRRKKHQPKRRSDVEITPGQPPRLQAPEPRRNSSSNKEDEPEQSDPFPMLLDKIMNDTKLHERLAETINKKRFTDHSQTPCQKPVATSTIVDEFFSPENPNMLSEDTIDGIISMTKNDPVFDSLLSIFEQEGAKKLPADVTSSHCAAFHLNTVTECVPDGGMMELSQDGFSASAAPGPSNSTTLYKASCSATAPSPVPSLTSPCPSVGSVTSSIGSPGHAPFQKKRRIKPIPCNPVTSALPVFSSPVMQELSPVYTPDPAPLTPSVPIAHIPAASPSPAVPAAAQQVFSVSSILAHVEAPSTGTAARQLGSSQITTTKTVSSAVSTGTAAQQLGPSQTTTTKTVVSAVSAGTAAQQLGSSQITTTKTVSSAVSIGTAAQQLGSSQTTTTKTVSSAVFIGTAAQQLGSSQTTTTQTVPSARATQQTESLQTPSTSVAPLTQTVAIHDILSVPAVHAPVVSVHASNTPIASPAPVKVPRKTKSVHSMHTPVASLSQCNTENNVRSTHVPGVASEHSSAPQHTVSSHASHTLVSNPNPTTLSQQTLSVSHSPVMVPVATLQNPIPASLAQLMPPPQQVTIVSQTVTSKRNNSNSHTVTPSQQTVNIQPVPVSRQQVVVVTDPDSTSGVNINIQENGVMQTFSDEGASTCQQMLPLSSFPSVSVIPSVSDSGNVEAYSSSGSCPPTNSLCTVTALPDSIIVPNSSPAHVSSPASGAAQNILNSLASGNLPSDSFVSSNTQMSFDLLAENNLSRCAFDSDERGQEQKSDIDDNFGDQGFPTVIINDQVFALSLSPNGKNCQVDKASPSVVSQVNQKPTVTVIAPTLPQIKPPASKTSVKKSRTKSRKKVVVVSPKHPSPSLSKLQEIVRQQLSPNHKNSCRPNILSKSPRATKTLSLPSDGYFISPSRSNMTDAESTESSSTNEYVAIPLGRISEDGYKKSLTFEDDVPICDSQVTKNVQCLTEKTASGVGPALPNKRPVKDKIKMCSRKPAARINGSSVVNVDIATTDGTKSCIMSLMSADGNLDIRKGTGGGKNKTHGNSKRSTKKSLVASNVSPSSSGGTSVTSMGSQIPSTVETTDNSLSIKALGRNPTEGSIPLSIKPLSKNPTEGNNNVKQFVPLSQNSLPSVQVTALKQAPSFSKEGTISTMIGSPKYANSPGHVTVISSEDSNFSCTSHQTAFSDPGPKRPIKGVKRRRIIAKTLTAIPNLNTPGQKGSRKRSNSVCSVNQNYSGNVHKKRKVPNLSNLNVDDFLDKVHQ